VCVLKNAIFHTNRVERTIQDRYLASARPSLLILAVWGWRSASIWIDAAGEGASIVELAVADPNRPSLFAVRGSRLLGAGGYTNQDYLPRFETPAEVMAAIDDYAIPLVLVSARNDDKQWAHLHQIAQAQQLFPDRWELIYRNSNAYPEVLLFRIRGNDKRIADAARLTALGEPCAHS
jgi:hypothetical protein